MKRLIITYSSKSFDLAKLQDTYEDVSAALSEGRTFCVEPTFLITPAREGDRMVLSLVFEYLEASNFPGENLCKIPSTIALSSNLKDNEVRLESFWVDTFSKKD